MALAHSVQQHGGVECDGRNALHRFRRIINGASGTLVRTIMLSGGTIGAVKQLDFVLADDLDQREWANHVSGG